MSHEVNIENQGAGVVVSLSGVITGRELTSINEHIYEADPNKKLRYQVWDFSDVEILEMKTEDIEKLVLQDMEEAISNSNQHVAIIGSSRTLRGVDNLYHYISDCWVKTGFQSKSFDNMDDARSWIVSDQPVEIKKCS